MIAFGLCLAALTLVSCFLYLLWWLERRDIRRFEQRTDLLKLRASSLKSTDVEEMKQRLTRLELKGLAR